MATKKQFPLSIIIGAVDRITAPLLRVQQKLNRFMRPIKRLQKSIRRMTNAAGFREMGIAVSRVGKATWKVAQQVGALTKRVLALGAAATGIATKLVIDFAKSGDSAAKFAKRLGVSAEWLQEMEYAADRSGVSVETLRMALQRAGRRVGQFVAEGRGEAAEVLKAMGLSADITSGKLTKLEDIMPRIIEKLAGIENANVRNAAAMKLFDSEGVALVQMLDGGIDSFSKLIEESRIFGQVISNESAAASETFIDRLTDMMAVLKGVRNIIGEALLPVVQEFIERFTKFILTNRGAIKKWAQQLADSIPPFDKLLEKAKAIMARIRPLIDLVGWLVDHVGVLKVVVAGLALLLGANLVASILALIPAITSLGIALLTTPIGWFALAIAGLVAAGYLLVKNWDAIKNGLKSLAIFVLKNNPFSIMLKDLNALISRVTGFDLKEKLGSIFGGFGGNDSRPAMAAPMMAPGAGVLSNTLGYQQAKVVVDFTNMPKGARVSADPKNTADLDLGMGFSLGAF